jgi:hypothetical protein
MTQDKSFENMNDGLPFILAGHSRDLILVGYVLAGYMMRHT